MNTETRGKQRYSRHWPQALVAVTALLVQPSGDGILIAGAREPVPVRITVFAAGTPSRTLVVEVTATDLATPLVFNLIVENGVASGVIRLPPGMARTIRVAAFDDAGNVTDEGSVTIDVRPGQNPPVNILLTPRAGQVPIVVSFGKYSVLVTPAQATIDGSASSQLQLSVSVTGPDGQAVANPQVSWSTMNPAAAIVSTSGAVTGLANAVVTIAATYEGVAGVSVITVTRIGGVAGCALWPLNPTNINPCATEVLAPNGALTIVAAGTYVYDTDAGVLTSPAGTAISPAPASAVIQQAGGALLRVVSVTALNIAPGATLRVRGEHSFVLLVYGAGTVSGTIDASAEGSLPGPGGDESLLCVVGSGTAGTSASSSIAAGGGGGGGYSTAGGAGGGGAMGGGAEGNGNIAPLRGGCSGGRGGGALDGKQGGAPGAGGGVLQIAVREGLTVTGTVRSAGGGGSSAGGITGGGGGGAGGSILLESGTIIIDAGARLCANGGSGAEGGSNNAAGGQGVPGACSMNPALTPDLLPGGGNGGMGGFASVVPSHGMNGSPGAGGGGGGSVGRVRVRGAISRVINPGAVVTPPATQ